MLEAKDIVTYILEAIAVTAVTGYILVKNSKTAPNWNKLIAMTITIAVSFIVLDLFAPDVSSGARLGAGFRTGTMMVGGTGEMNHPTGTQPTNSSPDMQLYGTQCGGMDDVVAYDYYSPINTELSGKVKDPQHAIFDTLIATSPTETVNVDTLQRSIDDRMALDSTKSNDMNWACATNDNGRDIHTIFQDGQRYKTTPFSTTSSTLLFESNPMIGGDSEGTPAATTTARMVYSGDLVKLKTNDGASVTLPGDSSYIRVTKDKPMGDNLFKLRFVLANGHDELNMVPIKYGDAVHIVYNNEEAHEVYLNHDGDLNNLKNTKDTVFSLVNSDDHESKELIDMRYDVLIRTAGTDQFLSSNPQRKRIETNATVDSATKFTVEPQYGCGPLWRFQR